ncbi:ARM repeat-containing protein [Cutaneotrichosporon oleaginosum]|uniref:ARM repeat-containing protein n=1 Tax=Cutaneotrichosporon oleaginosum TaxID=879819 RepID=A0A0J0XYD5_9TREE|nr:ARM repeat-containing protein [Cutaneotrichosporon oleaginosum]KLT46056.1 ARM repeat-containing protein [Cutaneotrichosporon oleaginosum]TXT06749.1 hypothetical protein COLE_06080 [Cutaneotrichosporon oleaginosum]
MTTSATLQALSAAATPADRLRALKDLKNSVIGNTWKKVEHASDDALLQLLLTLLENPGDDSVSVNIVCETAVIFGALGAAGALTLRPLLAEGVPQRLFALVRDIPPEQPGAARMLAPVLRALRNILTATADTLWGHNWGVGAEQKVVGTGLVGDDVLHPARVRGSARAASWRADASTALALVFEPENRDALLLLIEAQPEPNVLLPIYQLLARLTQRSSHRAAFGLHSADGAEVPASLVDHLLETVVDWRTPGQRPNAKLLEAALDLLSALVKGQPRISTYVRQWSAGLDVAADDGIAVPEVVTILGELLETGPPGVRIAVTGCLTNILKADKGHHVRDRLSLNRTNNELLNVIVKLLRTEAIEERVKLCFVLAALTSDDERLQKMAYEENCHTQLIGMLVEVDGDEERGELGHDAATRMREGALLALASLCFQYEPTRRAIADSQTSVLELVRGALRHPSYGVRAAACQLARALSRTVAILKTSLVDSGVGEEVIEALKREVARRKAGGDDGPSDGGFDVLPEQEVGERQFTVEVAATATICNLIVEFSPLQAKIADPKSLELLAGLTTVPYEPLVENALWVFKNISYHATQQLKDDIMAAVGWDALLRLMRAPTPPSTRVQALGILQNMLDKASSSQLARVVDALGPDFWGLMTDSLGDEGEVRVAALYCLGSVALGNERLRRQITERVRLVEALSDALGSRDSLVCVPALRALRHLLEKSEKGDGSRSWRPRQAVVDLLQPYQLKTRLGELAEDSPNVGVRRDAANLLELLERARA